MVTFFIMSLIKSGKAMSTWMPKMVFAQLRGGDQGTQDTKGTSLHALM